MLFFSDSWLSHPLVVQKTIKHASGWGCLLSLESYRRIFSNVQTLKKQVRFSVLTFYQNWNFTGQRHYPQVVAGFIFNLKKNQLFLNINSARWSASYTFSAGYLFFLLKIFTKKDRRAVFKYYLFFKLFFTYSDLFFQPFLIFWFKLLKKKYFNFIMLCLDTFFTKVNFFCNIFNSNTRFTFRKVKALKKRLRKSLKIK